MTNSYDSPKILRRPITPEVQESRKRDMESVLDDYRENLRDRGVSDEDAIERFIGEEREKMLKEYDSLDQGDSSSNIYYTPTNWDKVAEDMREQEMEEDDGMEM